jgi:hypothetical protein
MKRVFLLMVVSGLLVTLGFAQTPDAGSNTDQANVKGCLGGSDGNYTVAEDGTRQILKITSSSVDLKPHLGHDVNLIGHKASGAASSGAADNSFAVTELNMISDHCAAAAVAPVATASPSSETVSTPAANATTPVATVSPSSETVSPPAADATTPAATASPSSETVSTPGANATTPVATVSPSSETVSTPAANATTPVATVSPSSTVSAPAADAAQPTGQSASATKTAAAAAPAASDSPSSDPVIPTAADTTTPAANANASSETVSPPAAAATTPAVTHRSGSLFLLILVAVLVVVLGTLVPVFGRWRKRKMLERTGTPNLSFTKEESSDRNKPAPRKAA